MISGLSLTPVSSSELQASWTTDVTSDSSVKCALTTGGPYTLVSETVNPLSRGYSVTNHVMTIAGLSPVTPYFCVVASSSTGGTTISSELTATTNNILNPISINSFSASAATRYNDQFPINGRQMFGDSAYCAWAGDGNTYCSYQDGHIPNTATQFNTMVFSWPTSTDLTYSLASATNALTNAGTLNGQFNTNGWTDNRGWRTMGVFSIWDKASSTSILYDSLFRGGNTDAGLTSILKSIDLGAHWVAPQSNTGPGVVGSLNGDMPTPPNCMLCGVGFQYRLTPFLTCQDHKDCLNPVANERSYQYFFTDISPVGLARVRLENAPLQDGSLIQYYVGANLADDGNYPSAWSNNQTGQTLFANTATGIWPMATYLPDFHLYLITSWAPTSYSPSDITPTGLNIYTAQYPWSVPMLIGTISVPGTPTGYLPAFAQAQLATYKVTSSSPLTVTIKIQVSGYFTGQSTNPNTNQYSIFMYDVTLGH